MNNVYLIGRLANNPELKISENGSGYSNITLAVPRNYKNSDEIYETDFFNIMVWNPIAKSLVEHKEKGDTIGVRGVLRTSKDNEGKTHINIIADKLSFLDKSNINKEKDNMEER